MELTCDLGNNLLSDKKASDYMAEMTTKLISNIENQREKIIRDRLKALTGIELNLEEEQKRRFKSLSISYNGNEETIFYNDGSIEGKRIVTFVRKEHFVNFDTTQERVDVKYSFY